MGERCVKLEESITSVLFNYLRRGLFERDKLIVGSQLTFLVEQRERRLMRDALQQLLLMKPDPNAGGMGPMLAEWLPTQLWPSVKSLETIQIGFANTKQFETLGDDMQADADAWREWFDDEYPERRKLPGSYEDVSNTSFAMLLLLRALRPDRVMSALQGYVNDNMGKEFTAAGEPPFDMQKTYEEASCSTPIFFVLFPGVDPTPWVEALGVKFGITAEKDSFLNISMGQGQEKGAEDVIDRFSKAGSWVFLQNVHLMQSWLPKLERTLEVASMHADANFRCFISAEAPPLPYMKFMPESLMQSCIKVANEAPTDLKSNLRRAWANFDMSFISECSRPKQFLSTLFALCFFHSIVLGRRRFGQQGWSRPYSFNTGDLKICANVLRNYIDNNDEVPWADLRYLFGEIMYGGHITDFWDRRTNNTYLEVLFRVELFDGMELAPNFKSPAVVDGQPSLPHSGPGSYETYIEESLPAENPVLFGLHPNAEIGFLTASAQHLFSTIVSLSGGGGSDGSGGSGSASGKVMEDILSRLPNGFDEPMLADRAKPVLEDPSNEQGPYVVVLLQECGRANVLLREIRRTLEELAKGLNGQLSMSESMENLALALSINEVPGRNPFHQCSWERYAWPSKKSLSSWTSELLERVKRFQSWAAEMALPMSLWMPMLFNAQAFLTAVKQVTARKSQLPLDSMTVETHVTTMLQPVQCEAYPEDGAYVHGLFIEGARWSTAEEAAAAEEEPTLIGNTPTLGWLMDARLKELLPPMPVMFIKAVEVSQKWSAQAVGFMRHAPGIYDTPVYTTTFRGPTFVFMGTLNSKTATSKWTLSGTALIMQEND